MARFLLIHGSCHAAWCWDGTIAALEALGHEAAAIDLPAHGDDTPPESVTLTDYADAILGALDEPAIVVGHSMAGVPLTLAAESAPERFERLVYLCAYLPGDGDSVGTLRRAQDSQPLLPAIRRDRGSPVFGFDPELGRQIFYNDCSDAVAEAAIARLCPEPIAPQEERVTLHGKAQALPRSYILCSRDGAIPPKFQQRMAGALPLADLHERDWSHSPFLSDPEGLAALLDKIAGATPAQAV